MSDTSRSTGGAPLPAAGAPSPFGAATSARRRWVTIAVGVAVIAAAVIAAVLVTRRPAPAAVAAGQQHDAAPAADQRTPVYLSEADARRIGVTYAKVTAGAIERDIRSVGRITYDETRVATIAPKIDGYVEKLFVNITGQPVRVGDPLLAIYSPMLVTAQEELLLAARLARDVAGGTPEARRGAEELLASGRRRLAYWDVPASEIEALEQSGQVRKTLTLRSPNGGIVVEKAVLPGQRIMAGDALFKIADLGVVWAEGDVFEQDLALVRLGQHVKVEFEALPNRNITGTIAYIYPTLNAETRTAQVRVVLANPGLAIRPGMYGTIRIRVASGNSRALTIPRSALLVTGRRTLAFVQMPDGMLEPRDVVPGISTDDRVEILRGLKAGETVVASATFLVDAESNLSSSLGGMGDMPGMEIRAPKKPGPDAQPRVRVPAVDSGASAASAASAAKAAKVTKPMAPMPNMPAMPGMNHPASKP